MARLYLLDRRAGGRLFIAWLLWRLRGLIGGFGGWSRNGNTSSGRVDEGVGVVVITVTMGIRGVAIERVGARVGSREKVQSLLVAEGRDPRVVWISSSS